MDELEALEPPETQEEMEEPEEPVVTAETEALEPLDTQAGPEPLDSQDETAGLEPLDVRVVLEELEPLATQVLQVVPEPLEKLDTLEIVDSPEYRDQVDGLEPPDRLASLDATDELDQLDALELQAMMETLDQLDEPELQVALEPLEQVVLTVAQGQLELLTGPRGLTGGTGSTGPKGETGPRGPPGPGLAADNGGLSSCSYNNGGCEQTCSYSNGEVSCGCNAGYTLAGNMRSCYYNDVDECMNKTACQTNAICINTIGRHHCISLEFGVTHNDGGSPSASSQTAQLAESNNKAVAGVTNMQISMIALIAWVVVMTLALVTLSIVMYRRWRHTPAAFDNQSVSGASESPSDLSSDFGSVSESGARNNSGFSCDDVAAPCEVHAVATQL
ncbi:hypothetical protein NP493_352g01044 [Ridgeia piscesae]|uniref:EGF-like domain-containing protein n=1 Tax=Ridgeia piscesae TaxID=27915 RepID=A0AAD9NU56_RIDPI|nr:hypothetical protein NP493_352g01044 [Ridgeia piscesae]